MSINLWKNWSTVQEFRFPDGANPGGLSQLTKRQLARKFQLAGVDIAANATKKALVQLATERAATEDLRRRQARAREGVLDPVVWCRDPLDLRMPLAITSVTVDQLRKKLTGFEVPIPPLSRTKRELWALLEAHVASRSPVMESGDAAEEEVVEMSPPSFFGMAAATTETDAAARDTNELLPRVRSAENAFGPVDADAGAAAHFMANRQRLPTPFDRLREELAAAAALKRRMQEGATAYSANPPPTEDFSVLVAGSLHIRPAMEGECILTTLHEADVDSLSVDALTRQDAPLPVVLYRVASGRAHLVGELGAAYDVVADSVAVADLPASIPWTTAARTDHDTTDGPVVLIMDLQLAEQLFYGSRLGSDGAGTYFDGGPGGSGPATAISSPATAIHSAPSSVGSAAAAPKVLLDHLAGKAYEVLKTDSMSYEKLQASAVFRRVMGDDRVRILVQTAGSYYSLVSFPVVFEALRTRGELERVAANAHPVAMPNSLPGLECYRLVRDLPLMRSATILGKLFSVGWAQPEGAPGLDYMHPEVISLTTVSSPGRSVETKLGMAEALLHLEQVLVFLGGTAYSNLCAGVVRSLSTGHLSLEKFEINYVRYSIERVLHRAFLELRTLTSADYAQASAGRIDLNNTPGVAAHLATLLDSLDSAADYGVSELGALSSKFFMNMILRRADNSSSGPRRASDGVMGPPAAAASQTRRASFGVNPAVICCPYYLAGYLKVKGRNGAAMVCRSGEADCKYKHFGGLDSMTKPALHDLVSGIATAPHPVRPHHKLVQEGLLSRLSAAIDERQK